MVQNHLPKRHSQNRSWDRKVIQWTHALALIHHKFLMYIARNKRLPVGLVVLLLLQYGCGPKRLPVPDHIVIAIMENRSRTEIIGAADAPYITGLATGNHSANFTQSFGVEHPSQPNYFDLFSGSNQGVGDDAVPKNQPYNTDNLARELMDAGKTFVSYSEDLPGVGSNDSVFGAYRRNIIPLRTGWARAGSRSPTH